jgi:hypothetical protein
MKSVAVLILGLVVLAFGTLFALQGAGVVHWPRESFMLDQRDWIEKGMVVALIGLALIATAWRIRR